MQPQRPTIGAALMELRFEKTGEVFAVYARPIFEGESPTTDEFQILVLDVGGFTGHRATVQPIPAHRQN